MTPELRDLTGQVVAITGASAGIGRETARQLVAAGAKVALGARRVDRLNDLVAELGADNAIAVPTDVTKPDDLRALVGAAVAKWGRLDTMVANAGIGIYGGVMDATDAELDHMVDVNLMGTSGLSVLPFRRCSPAGAVTSSSCHPWPACEVGLTNRSMRPPSTPNWAWPTASTRSCGPRTSA